MPNKRLALLGCGYWGQNLARNFHQLGALALVCDPAETGRLKARQIAPGTEVCDRFEPVFDRADIDAVVIATPAETHFDLVMQALKAGKDVLVEKPLALNHNPPGELTIFETHPSDLRPLSQRSEIRDQKSA
jgi:UDP-2-acetamido-3-amino-2,3-dideoxy-glucuronate N-acetyltransferase